MEKYSLENGATCNLEHGFWQLIRVRPEPFSSTSGHDNGPVRSGLRANQFVEGVQPDEAPVAT